MPDSDTDRLASALHRSVLGVMLALVALLTLGWGARAVLDGRPLGALGVLVGLGAVYWIVDLFREGMREA